MGPVSDLPAGPAPAGRVDPADRSGPGIGPTGEPPGPVLVVDYGAQYAQLIARRVREARVYSEIVPHNMAVADIVARRPSAIILSGGPESVYAEGAPQADPALFSAGIPVLGICYGLQAMAVALDGVVGRTGKGEFGRTEVDIDPGSQLLRGLPAHLNVWMSHRDAAVRAPAGSRCTASSGGAPIAAFEDPVRRLYSVQWHPEVVHSDGGQRLIENFLYHCAGVAPTWTTGSIIEDAVKSIAATVGSHPVIAGLSGGVDSAVAAALVQRAVGDQLTCVFVDHGLLREGEREQVEQDYVKATGAGCTPCTPAASSSTPWPLCPTRPTPRANARRSAGSSYGRSKRRPGRSSGLRAGSAPARSASSCRGRSTPTSSSPVGGRGRPISRATTTLAAPPRFAFRAGGTAAPAVQGRGAGGG